MHKANEKFFTHSIEDALFDDPKLMETPERKAWKMAITFYNVMKSNKIKEILFFKGDC